MGFLKRQQVIGLPVLQKEGLSLLGRVEDLLLNRRGERVVALLLEGGGLFQKRRLFPREEILAFGPDVILAGKPVELRSPGKGLEPLLAPARLLLGRRVLDEGGRDLGTVDDLFFHPETGDVVGYALSMGLLADLWQGPSFLPRGVSLQVGEGDTLLVRRIKEGPGEES